MTPLESIKLERMCYLNLMEHAQINYDAVLIDYCCENLDRLKPEYWRLLGEEHLLKLDQFPHLF